MVKLIYIMHINSVLQRGYRYPAHLCLIIPLQRNIYLRAGPAVSQ